MTLRVDADPARWMYVPSHFPWQGHERIEDWSGTLIAALTDLHGYDADQQDLFRAYAEGLSRGVDTGEHRYAYLTQPHREVAVASFYEWPPLEASEDELLGALDGRALRPPVAEEFESAALGAGRVCIRHVADDDGVVTAIGHWVWRFADRDVIMVVGDADVPRFARLRPIFDELARAISLVPGDTERSSLWRED